MSQVFELDYRVWLPASREEVFAVLSDARNLNRLTPRWFHLVFRSPVPEQLEVGTRIDYRLWWHGLPLRWQSHFTVWEPPYRFTYEQGRGPYRSFVHDHIFEEKDGGTEVVDRYSYSVLGGGLVNQLIVHRDMEGIMRYRKAALEGLFPGSEVPKS